jgi:Ca-activated chloride channel family protein
MYELSHPWFLILLLVPPFMIFFCPPVTLKSKTALRVPFFSRWQKYEEQQQKLVQELLWPWHWFGIWVLLILSLAGPRWVGLPQTMSLETYHMMMVLDISGSMGLKDMPSHGRYQTRWDVVKDTATQFVKKRRQDSLGLILFGERAYLFAPLTYDKTTLIERINDASVGLAGQATALGDAIGLGVMHLKKTPKKGRIMILLTDGVANAGFLPPLKAAKIAKKEGIKIYVIGLGPSLNQQEMAGLFWQMQQAQDLDEPGLKEIAKTTEGLYFRATDASGLEKIYHAINQLAKVKEERAHLRPEKQYFYFPLLLALTWILLLFGVQAWRNWSRR